MKNLEKPWKTLKNHENPWKTLKILWIYVPFRLWRNECVLLRNECNFLSLDNISLFTMYRWTTFVKEFFWFKAMSRLWPNECILWPNERTFLSSHYIFFIVVYSWTTFVKEFFKLEASFKLWRNECFLICDKMNEQFVTKRLHFFVFW